MNYKYFYLLGLFLLMIACGDDATTLPEEKGTDYIEEAIFGCNTTETTDLKDIGLSFVEDYISWNNLHFISANDKLLLRSGGVDGTKLIKKSMDIRKFLATDTKMLICAYSGIYSVDMEGILMKRTEKSCGDIEFSDNGEIIFSSFGDNLTGILRLDEDDIVHPFMEVDNFLPDCVPYEDIIVVDDNNIFASTCAESVVQFKNKQFSNTFGKEEMGLPGTPASNQFFVASHEDDLIVVAKNGPGFYYVLKYTAEGEWIKLKTLESETSKSEKDRKMLLPSTTSVLVQGDLLYVSTTIAGCHGIHKFDVSKNEELSGDDYGIIQVPDFPSQCLEKLKLNSDGSLVVLTSNAQIINLDCN